MVVHHSDRLHVRIADRRPDKPEASTLQVLAHPVRLLGSRRDLFQGSPPAPFRSRTREPPDVRVKAPELLLNGQEGFGIFDGGGDLRSVADDAGIGQEGPDLPRIVSGDSRRIESIEGLSEVFAFLQDRQPGEPRLCPFEDEKFKELAIVVFRDAPFGVVIGEEGRVAQSPFAPLDRIVAHSHVFLHRPPFRKTKHRAMPSVKSSPFRTEELRDELRRLRGSLTLGKWAASSVGADRGSGILGRAGSAVFHGNWTLWWPERTGVGGGDRS